MNTLAAAAARRHRLPREDGQALFLMIAALVVLLGFAGLVIDFGRAYVAQRQLQQAVDAAALVAGQTLPDSTTASAEAIAYSAIGKNAHPLSMNANAPTITFKCLTTLVNANVPCQKNNDPDAPSKDCVGTTATVASCNAVQVTQTATVQTTFARLFIPHFNVTARSTVGMRGGVPHPFDIMIVLDRTGSMAEDCDSSVKDASGDVIISSNNSTKLDCAKDGVRQLLKGLLPCNQGISGPCGNAQPLDKVGMMVFPPLNAPTAKNHDAGTSAVAPVPARQEVDRLTVSSSPNGGNFTMDVNGTTTAHVNWPITTAAIQTAIANIVGPSNVTATPGPGGTTADPIWTVTFASSLGDVGFDVDEHLTSGAIDASENTKGVTGTPGSPAIPPSRTNLMLDSDVSCSAPVGASTWPSWYPSQSKDFPDWLLDQSDVGYGTAAVAPVVAVGEVDRLAVSSSPSGGYFTMDVNGTTTAHVNWPITTAAIQTAIANIVGPSNVTATPGPGGTTANPIWTVTFASSLGDVGFDVDEHLTSGAIDASENTKGVTGTPGSPAVEPNYTFAPLSNDFRTSDAPGLNASSTLVKAITWAACPGGASNGIASETSIGYPRNTYYGINAIGSTYYTGALVAAQEALAAEQAASPRGAQPVIIFLSDGQANTGAPNPCTTAMTAARDAAASGTWIYSIAYNVSVSSQISDSYCQYPSGTRERTTAYPQGVAAYHTLAQIARISEDASDPSKFFCVGTPSQPGEPCQDAATLSEVFQSIGTSLTAPRLYPDDTQ